VIIVQPAVIDVPVKMGGFTRSATGPVHRGPALSVPIAVVDYFMIYVNLRRSSGR
jgi:hypothetical protein